LAAPYCLVGSGQEHVALKGESENKPNNATLGWNVRQCDTSRNTVCVNKTLFVFLFGRKTRYGAAL